MYSTKHITRLFIVLMILAISISLVQAQDDSDEGQPDVIEYTVTADTANIRAEPSTNASIVAVASKDETLLIYDEEPETSGWLRVYSEDEDDAYIADFLVEQAPTRFYPVTQEPVLEFSGRGKTISDVFDLPRGAYRVDAVVEDNAFILGTVVVEGDCRDTNIFNEFDLDSNRLVISALLVSQGCSLLFESDNVDREWSVEVRDLLDEAIFPDSVLVVEEGNNSIEGKGRTLTMPTFLEEGLWIITANVDDRAFILQPQVLEGDCESRSAFNEFEMDADNLEIETTYRAPEDGCIIFWEISNVDATWHIAFDKLR